MDRGSLHATRAAVTAGLLLGILVQANAVHAADNGPSVAVFALEAGTGVKPGTAKLLTDNLVEELRDARVFGRVVSSSEIEALVGFERQKQLMACDASSCLTELAGALGVDFIVVGSVGRLGKSYLFFAKMLDVRNARTVASTKHRSKGRDEEALLDLVDIVARTLVREAHLKKNPPVPDALKPVPAPAPAPVVPAPTAPSREPAKAAPAPAPAVAPAPGPAPPPEHTTTLVLVPVPTPPPTEQPAPHTASQQRETLASGDLPPQRALPPAESPVTPAAHGPGPLRLALMAVGGGTLVASLGALLLGAGSGGAGVVTKILVNAVYIPGAARNLTVIQVGYVGLWMLGLVGVVACLGLLVVGGVALVLGVALPD